MADVSSQNRSGSEPQLQQHVTTNKGTHKMRNVTKTHAIAHWPRIGTANARKRQKHACAHINKQANIRCHRTRFSQRHQCPMRSQHTDHHPASTLNRRKQGGRPKRTRDARCARPAHPHAGLCLCGHSAAACQPPPQRAARQHLVASTSHLKLRPRS